MKEYKEPKVKTVTTVIDLERNDDSIDDCGGGVKIEGMVERDAKAIDIAKWENDYKDVLTEEPGLTNLTKFSIDTSDSRPIQQHPYSIPVSLRKAVDEKLDWLIDKGYIRQSESKWGSPMFVVKKPNGKVRLCIDYRKVNGVTTDEPFYMPRVDEVLESVGQSKVISKLDLAKGYYQVLMDDDSIDKTAFSCHRGRFEFVRMPFGLKNAPAIFQTLMTKVLDPCREFASPYMDDVVIYSTDWKIHVRHVRQLLDCLRRAGLTANPWKCHWGGSRMEFLGHTIGEGKMTIPEDRARAIGEYRRPITKKGMRSFVGAVGFYRKYVEMLAKETAVLSPATSKSAPNRIQWTEEMVSAFNSIRHTIAHACSLTIPLVSDKISIVTDASGRGIGGVLQVERSDNWEAAAFFSRQLRGAEYRYSATEMEALALVEAVKHFAYYLYGKRFVAYMDHKPLCYLLEGAHLNNRLKRMSYKLQPWQMTIEYLPGKDNTLADALSRQE